MKRRDEGMLIERQVVAKWSSMAKTPAQIRLDPANDTDLIEECYIMLC